MLALGLISSSCGTSPDDEPFTSDPIQAPPSLTEQPVSLNQTAIPINSAIPIAARVAGRPGFVFNPYNQNMVEVNGVRSGTKVLDPQDPDPSHVFVVP